MSYILRVPYITQLVNIHKWRYFRHSGQILNTFEVNLLPFLKNKQEGAISEAPDALERESDDVDLLELVVKELFDASTDKDRAAAFRAIFQILEQEPHDEVEQDGEHANPESAAGF